MAEALLQAFSENFLAFTFTRSNVNTKVSYTQDRTEDKLLGQDGTPSVHLEHEVGLSPLHPVQPDISTAVQNCFDKGGGKRVRTWGKEKWRRFS